MLAPVCLFPDNIKAVNWNPRLRCRKMSRSVPEQLWGSHPGSEALDELLFTCRAKRGLGQFQWGESLCLQGQKGRKGSVVAGFSVCAVKAGQRCCRDTWFLRSGCNWLGSFEGQNNNGNLRRKVHKSDARIYEVPLQTQQTKWMH